GQGALLIQDPSALDNPFYRLAPQWASVPLLLLAFLATIIASQAVISGAFSIVKQAVQLGYIPRLRIKHTSEEEIGQVYVSKVNLFLFLGVVSLVLLFRNSESLASAYGISVTGAMAIDTLLAGYFVMAIKNWGRTWCLPLFVLLFAVDILFLAANLFKFFDGGWLPIAVAAVALVLMISWITGRERLLAARWSGAVSLADFFASIRPGSPPRVPGTAIFMVPNQDIAPMALMHNLKHNKVLHERVLLMHVVGANIPHIPDTERISVDHLEHNFHRVTVRYGFMEEPNIPRVLAFIRVREFHLSLLEVSFFIGKEKVVAKKSLTWNLALFIFLHRTMLAATEYYRLPGEHTIELGGHVEI
ncbi:MAG: KUP/HAK/KT family potassium transporter, partial [Rhodoferax sp.]